MNKKDKCCERELSRSDINDLIIDYFIIKGDKSAAECFAKESGDDHDTQNLNAMDTRMKIKNLITNGQVLEARELLNQLNASILQTDVELNFSFAQQEFFEMFKKYGSLQAMEFAQSMLAPLGINDEKFLPEIQKSIAVVIFRNTQSCPESLRIYLDSNRRSRLAAEVNKAILRATNLGSEPRLVKLMQYLEYKQRQMGEKVPGYVKVDGLTDQISK